MVELDTSGSVTLIEEFAPGCDHVKFIEWSDLDPFKQGYVEALFAGMARHSDAPFLRFNHPFGGKAGRHVGFSDLAPETLAAILKDCNRQDGDLALQFPPLTPYLGDDGKVYLKETVNG